MLLLLLAAATATLFAGCSASDAAKPELRMAEDTSVDAPLVPTMEFVSIIEMAVRSTGEMNDETARPVLNELYAMIHSLDLATNFTLTVKKITRVSGSDP